MASRRRSDASTCWVVVLVALCFGHADALPRWSWDTLGDVTYIHCANMTGEWNAEALQTLAKKPFVVFEKNHKLFAPPINTSAETKISESCRLVKQINPNVTCLMYVESDWARTFYSLGHWFEENPTKALQCPETGQFINTTDVESLKGDVPINGSETFTYHFLAYDFSIEAAREQWISRVTDAVATGYVDGAFIDGNRGGFDSGILGPCSSEKKVEWASGLNETVAELARRLGESATLISNYPTPEALKLCSGGMFERGGSIPNIMAFGKQTCGLWNTPCLLDYHAQYADRSLSGAQSAMANFLVAMNKYSYFGIGGGWGGPGAGACASWLHEYPEYSKPLGSPLGDAVVAKGADQQPTYTRKFASGTVAYVGQYLTPIPPQRPGNRGECIFWADNTTTGNASNCPPKAVLLSSWVT